MIRTSATVGRRSAVRPRVAAHRSPGSAQHEAATLATRLPSISADQVRPANHTPVTGPLAKLAADKAVVAQPTEPRPRRRKYRSAQQALPGGAHGASPLDLQITRSLTPVIRDTISALEQLAPEVIVPAHCTGWKATHAIARRLPEAFIQNSVGTTFHLTAAAAA